MLDQLLNTGGGALCCADSHPICGNRDLLVRRLGLIRGAPQRAWVDGVELG